MQGVAIFTKFLSCQLSGFGRTRRMHEAIVISDFLLSHITTCIQLVITVYGGCGHIRSTRKYSRSEIVENLKNYLELSSQAHFRAMFEAVYGDHVRLSDSVAMRDLCIDERDQQSTKISVSMNGGDQESSMMSSLWARDSAGVAEPSSPNASFRRTPSSNASFRGTPNSPNASFRRTPSSNASVGTVDSQGERVSSGKKRVSGKKKKSSDSLGSKKSTDSLGSKKSTDALERISSMKVDRVYYTNVLK